MCRIISGSVRVSREIAWKGVWIFHCFIDTLLKDLINILLISTINNWADHIREKNKTNLFFTSQLC